MSSATAVKFEHRCTRCYRQLFADVDEAGKQTTCRYCGQQLSLPEATPDRIARAAEADIPATAAGEAPAEVVMAETSWSDADIERELKQQLYVPPGEMRCMSTIASSRIKRFLGALIDNFLLISAGVAGFAALMALGAAGWVNTSVFETGLRQAPLLDVINAMGVLYFPAAVLCLFQWRLIAVRGQSIGKFLLAMRIVSCDGRYPGFFQGVILRNWVRNLLNMVPFFGLLDALFIFGDSRRCLHDYLAGTHVVDG